MAKVVAITVISSIFIFLLLNVQVSGKFSAADNGAATEEYDAAVSSVLELKGLNSSEEECEQMYGFLPCSKSLFGHLFLIVVYEYLLFHGETYLLSGGGRIFEILGTGFFGASAFPVIAQLPESLILLVTGLFSSDEGAQANVLTGVGLVAGSTIFNLTLLWGTCLFLGRQVFVYKANSNPDHKENSGDIEQQQESESQSTAFLASSNPDHNKSSGDIEQQQEPELQSTALLASYNSNDNSSPAESKQKKPPTLLTGYGVSSDAETRFTAKLMLLSLIPFIIILLPKLFFVPYGSRGYNMGILITLVTLVITLLSYFIYQFSHSSLQDRRLDYLKVEHQTHVLAVINHVQEYVPERLLDEHGAPNEAAILRLFQKLDKDGDQQLSLVELTELFNRIKLTKSVLSREQIIENIMRELDQNKDEKVSPTEFVRAVKHWLHTTMCAADEPVRHSHKKKEPIKHLNEAINTVVHEEKLKKVKAQILEHIQQTNDEELDEPAITKMFHILDVDKSNSLTQAELRALIIDLHSDDTQFARDTMGQLFKDLDTDGNEEISLDEFTEGLKRWIRSTRPVNAEPYKVDRSAGAWVKAIFLLLVGIAMLGILAEPLIHSVQKFSTAAHIPSFYAAFVLVPLATSARTAISAIRAVRDKIPKNTRLTFSEIYDGVFMNNVLGFSVLLSVVYFRGLVWHFSAEVMIVVIVGAVIGFMASFMSRFPVWIMFIAYLLYPLSLILVYFVDDYFWSP